MQETLEIYATRQGLSEECIGLAHALKIHALSQLGAMLKVMEKNKGLQGSIVTGSKQEPVRDTTPTLAELGVDKKTSMVAQHHALYQHVVMDCPCNCWVVQLVPSL